MNYPGECDCDDLNPHFHTALAVIPAPMAEGPEFVYEPPAKARLAGAPVGAETACPPDCPCLEGDVTDHTHTLAQHLDALARLDLALAQLRKVEERTRHTQQAGGT